MPRPRTVAVVALVVAAPLWAATARVSPRDDWRLSTLATLLGPLRAVQQTASRLFGWLPGPWHRPAAGPSLPAAAALPSREEAVRLDELTREVERLRRLLHLKQSQARPTVAAHVIGRDATPWFRTLVLDVGRDADLTEGAAVVSPAGLTGQLIEVGPAAARVALITDPRFRVAALVQRTRAQGLAVGTARGRCYLAYLAAADAAQPGDLVLTAGDGGLLPKGLILGEVVRVEPDASGLYWQALLKPAVNAGAVEDVLCVR